jgi:hypothetical protein
MLAIRAEASARGYPLPDCGVSSDSESFWTSHFIGGDSDNGVHDVHLVQPQRS